MREIGIKVFDRFNASPADEIWYHQEICTVLSSSIRPTLAWKVRRVIIEMTELGNELESPPRSAPGQRTIPCARCGYQQIRRSRARKLPESRPMSVADARWRSR